MYRRLIMNEIYEILADIRPEFDFKDWILNITYQ